VAAAKTAEARAREEAHRARDALAEKAHARRAARSDADAATAVGRGRDRAPRKAAVARVAQVEVTQRLFEGHPAAGNDANTSDDDAFSHNTSKF
jgi:hypothetical protein